MPPNVGSIGFTEKNPSAQLGAAFHPSGVPRSAKGVQFFFNEKRVEKRELRTADIII
jgi:hypothetical protein